MRLWRISNYADLTGRGGQLAEGRWHSKGRPILYCAESPAGTLIEFLVHLPKDLMPSHFQLIELDVSDEASRAEIPKAAMPENWPRSEAVTRKLGDAWLQTAEALLLRVPSAILPDTWNVLINPAHTDMHNHVKIVKTERAPLDGRLA